MTLGENDRASIPGQGNLEWICNWRHLVCLPGSTAAKPASSLDWGGSTVVKMLILSANRLIFPLCLRRISFLPNYIKSYFTQAWERKDGSARSKTTPPSLPLLDDGKQSKATRKKHALTMWKQLRGVVTAAILMWQFCSAFQKSTKLPEICLAVVVYRCDKNQRPSNTRN